MMQLMGRQEAERNRDAFCELKNDNIRELYTSLDSDSTIAMRQWTDQKNMVAHAVGHAYLLQHCPTYFIEYFGNDFKVGDKCFKVASAVLKIY